MQRLSQTLSFHKALLHPQSRIATPAPDGTLVRRRSLVNLAGGLGLGQSVAVLVPGRWRSAHLARDTTSRNNSGGSRSGIEMGRPYARIFCAIRAVGALCDAGAYFLPSPLLLFLSLAFLLPGWLPFFSDPHAIGESEWSSLTLAWTAVTAKVFGLPWRHFFCSNAEKRESELSGRPTFSQSTGRESPVTPVNFRFPFRSPHDIFAIAGEPSCPSIK